MNEKLKGEKFVCFPWLHLYFVKCTKYEEIQSKFAVIFGQKFSGSH